MSTFSLSAAAFAIASGRTLNPMMIALDAGAEDFEADEECYTITTTPEDFSSVREALETKGIEFLEAEIQMVPSTYISLDEKDSEKMQRLIDNLEDLDDVMNVYHNWDEPEEDEE